MAPPQPRHSSQQPRKPRSRAPARDHRADVPAVPPQDRKDACIAARQSCRSGAHRAGHAYTEIVDTNVHELTQEYHLHDKDHPALRRAPCKVSSMPYIVSKNMHYVFMKDQAPGVSQGARPSATAGPLRLCHRR